MEIGTAWVGGKKQRERKLRSVSLPSLCGTKVARPLGRMPSIQEVREGRDGWGRLGLYMKGLPPKKQAVSNSEDPNEEGKDGEEESEEENHLTAAATSALFSLKADRGSLEARAELQKRQRSIALSSLAEEVMSCRTSSLGLGQGELDHDLDKLTSQLSKLISSAEQYGALRCEEQFSIQLETLSQYADSLVRKREELARQTREAMGSLDSDTLDALIAHREDMRQQREEFGSPVAGTASNQTVLHRFSLGIQNSTVREEGDKVTKKTSEAIAANVEEMLSRGKRKSTRMSNLRPPSESSVMSHIDSVPDDGERWRLLYYNIKETLARAFHTELDRVSDLVYEVDLSYSLHLSRQITSGALLFAAAWLLITTFLAN